MFSAQTHRYFREARGYGKLVRPTHQSAVGEVEHGQFFQLQLVVDAQGVVTDLAFYCPRCLPAIACGGYLYERLVGGQLGQALTIEQVIQDLGGLPPQRVLCAWMAVEAVRTLKGVP